MYLHRELGPTGAQIQKLQYSCIVQECNLHCASRNEWLEILKQNSNNLALCIAMHSPIVSKRDSFQSCLKRWCEPLTKALFCSLLAFIFVYNLPARLQPYETTDLEFCPLTHQLPPEGQVRTGISQPQMSLHRITLPLSFYCHEHFFCFGCFK